MSDKPNLAGLLAIWPIAQSFAMNTPVGDLITLGRINSSLRSSLHGRIPQAIAFQSSPNSKRNSSLDPEIGKHQTADWVYLKAIAPFLCSSSTHTRGETARPCVYCSKPICDACIVRDSFKRRNENTFKNRLRYLCRDCWSEGNPARNFRYPALEISDDGTVLEPAPRLHDGEDPSHEADGYCTCNLKDNGWLCLDCKGEQNSSKSAPSNLLLDTDLQSPEISCYGLDCTNTIDLSLLDKDRRRVCLWCQKPLRRQFGGEDRYAWNLKTIEARARNAESRSRDLEEYNRRRLKVMRMSRREMRGSEGPDDDVPIFVRHLDTMNYRNWMTQASAPDPETVWKSKNGYWRYDQGFLCAVQKRCKRVRFTHVGGVPIAELRTATQEGGLKFARSNQEMYPNYLGPGIQQIPQHGRLERNIWCMNELKARILDMHLEQGQDLNTISAILHHEYGLEINKFEITQQLEKWLETSKPRPKTNQGGEAVIDGIILPPISEEQIPQNTNTQTLPSPEQSREVTVDVESLTIDANQATPGIGEHQSNDDPPPYVP